MGTPGKALKLDDAQKNVSFHSGTKMQLGSGWKPGSMGFQYVELGVLLEAPTIHQTASRNKVAENSIAVA
jgi:hypothetical protein